MFSIGPTYNIIVLSTKNYNVYDRFLNYPLGKIPKKIYIDDSGTPTCAKEKRKNAGLHTAGFFRIFGQTALRSEIK
ncbi:hypothetical protein RCL_jg15668.t1 [Rhizophagus clarus]|uniref:Uncharacterized protein n=1 Tax=Rhizophagus clarus TaxID=94130 RepID=A0A8H3MD04_9GLOM|nr:hypothetical protein RCL_jg15668.t1 [Rhizophagus clarus]